MRMKRMCLYSLQGVIKSGAYRAFLWGVILSIALPVLFLTATDSMLYTAAERRKDIYGEFTDLYYGMEEGRPEEGDGGLYDRELVSVLGTETEKVIRAGNLYGADLALLEENGDLEPVLRKRQEASVDFLGNKRTSGLLAAGYLDETAARLGRIRLKEGSWPEKDQAAVTESLRKELGSPDVGEAVSWRGKTYEISGILADYGMLWVSNMSQSDSDRLVPELLLSEEDFWAEAAELQVSHQTLLEASGVFSGEIYSGNFRLVQNLPVKNQRFSVPPVILALVYICAGLLMAQLLLLNLPKLEKRMRLCRLLGVEAGKVPGLFYLDLSWIFLMAVPAGLFLGIGGAAFLGWICGRMAEMEVLFRIRPMRLLGAVLLSGGLMALGGIRPAVRLYKLPVLEKQKNGFMKKKRMFSTALLGLLLFSVFFLHGAADCYLKSDERLNLSVPVYGKLPTDYDYEFLASTISSDTNYQDEDGNYIGMSVMEPDDIFTVYNEPYLGMEEEDLEYLRTAEGVRKVTAYKECTQLKLPLDREDPYQRAIEDNFMSSGLSGYDEKVREIFGLEETYVDARLQGYSEEELLGLSSYVEEGEIHLDKIRSGEEVILMVPDLEVGFRPVEGGGQIMSIRFLEMGAYSGEEGQYRDTYYRPGDTVTLTRLYSEDSGLRGFVKEDTVREEVRRQDITVTIGAVIHCRAGWFEKSNSPLPYFNFLCLNETFDALDLSSTYTRVRVSGREGEEDALRQAVYRLSADLPEMELEDRQGFMEEYRQYHMLLEILSVLLAALSAVMGAGVLFGQLFARMQEERKQTGLYQVAGYTRRRLYWRLIRPAAVLLPAVWALAMGAVVLLARWYYFLEGYWGVSKWLQTLAAALLLAGGIFLVLAGRFFKESISSLIREED